MASKKNAVPEMGYCCMCNKEVYPFKYPNEDGYTKTRRGTYSFFHIHCIKLYNPIKPKEACSE